LRGNESKKNLADRIYGVDILHDQLTYNIHLETQHVVKNEKTARNYVKRLEATGDKPDAVTGEMLWQTQVGLVLPISLLEKAESGIKDTVSPSPQHNPPVTTFVKILSLWAGIPGERAAAQT
jgi:hypothetical protein